MAEYVRRRWEPRFGGMTRRDRQGCSYDACLPILSPRGISPYPAIWQRTSLTLRPRSGT